MQIIFTKHAQRRMVERNIPKEDILDGLANPYRLEKDQNKGTCQKLTPRGIIEIVFEKKDNNLIVITAYWV
jgi:hypothetical protein